MPKVLIVDDCPDNIRLLQHILECDGFEVRSAESGPEAIEAAAEFRPDTILLDVMMPDMDGIEVCQHLKSDERLQAIPVILVTAMNQDDDVIKGFDVGADDYVTKPFKRAIILARTRSAVKRYLAHEENRKLLAQVEQLASTDPLTDLLNRRTFFEHFNRELDLARRHGHRLSCVLLDIDFFKNVNDEYGHGTGDEAIKAIARSLQDGCRATDFVCRYGGEEFCLLLSMTSEAEAVHWAERARKKIALLEIPTDKQSIRVTASFGVSDARRDSVRPEDLVELADHALMVAKRSGRNRVVNFSGLDDTQKLSFSDSYQEGDETPLATVYAADIMTTPISCLLESAPLIEAAKSLLALSTNSMPVVDENGLLVGILSEKDLMASHLTLNEPNRKVSDVMFRNVVHFDEDAPAQHVLDFLCRNTIRRVVVVQGLRPTGVISRGNLLRWLSDWNNVCDETLDWRATTCESNSQ